MIKTNIYWPVYKNIESEIVSLTFDIHIDDNQLNVYSSKISDLILRASSEIESISKELYLSFGSSKKEQIKYDDALKFLNQKWNLESKVVIISSSNCFQTNRVLRPFIKNEKRTINKKLTYSWNNSYQNLKHNRAKYLNFASIKYLFDIMSALYILNIYFKNEIFELERDSTATNFPLNLGSDLFSIKIHKSISYHFDRTYVKNEDFDECIYLVKYTEDSYEHGMKTINEINEINKKMKLEYLTKKIQTKYPKGTSLNQDNVKEVESFIKKTDKSIGNKFTIQAAQKNIKEFEKLKFEAIPNQNQV